MTYTFMALVLFPTLPAFGWERNWVDVLLADVFAGGTFCCSRSIYIGYMNRPIPYHIDWRPVWG